MHLSDIPTLCNYRQKQTFKDIAHMILIHIMVFKTIFEQLCLKFSSTDCEGKVTLDFDLNWPNTNVTTPFSTKITITLVYT